jgi:hypothetical protein
MRKIAHDEFQGTAMDEASELIVYSRGLRKRARSSKPRPRS